jgi:hypothetical protein
LVGGLKGRGQFVQLNGKLLHHLIAANGYNVAVFLSYYCGTPTKGECDRLAFVVRCRRLGRIILPVTLARLLAENGWQDWQTKIV